MTDREIIRWGAGLTAFIVASATLAGVTDDGAPPKAIGALASIATAAPSSVSGVTAVYPGAEYLIGIDQAPVYSAAQIHGKWFTDGRFEMTSPTEWRPDSTVVVLPSVPTAYLISRRST